MLTSQICKFTDYEMKWYRNSVLDMDEGFTLHRKQWEFAAIIQILKERGCLESRNRGLGFAVGMEPLASVFASYGTSVVATDQPYSEEESRKWYGDRGAFNVDVLYRESVCSRHTFDALVRYEPVDMRSIPDHLVDFDFCWSACALEHLGDLEAGYTFIRNALKTVKVGGWCVHTTEYNVSSNDTTTESGDSVIYRRKDLEGFFSTLENAKVEPMDWDTGTHILDLMVDREGPDGWLEYNPHPLHIKLEIDGYTITSAVLVFQRTS